MAYELEFLTSAVMDILKAEASLYDLSLTAADRFTYEIQRLSATLCVYPFMYQVYEDDGYFRSMPLPYGYQLFYHVLDEAEIIKVHRVIHGMKDLNRALYE